MYDLIQPDRGLWCKCGANTNKTVTAKTVHASRSY